MTSKPHFEGETDARYVDQSDNKKYIFKPRALSIVWGNDNRYWRLPEKGDKSDNVNAELLQVCWLEVTGTLPLQNPVPGTTYNISFKIGMKPDAFGWSGNPVYVMAKIGKKGKYVWKSATLGSTEAKTEIPEGEILQITIPPGPPAADSTIYFGLYEIWKGRWKGGLQIYEATIKSSVPFPN